MKGTRRVTQGSRTRRHGLNCLGKAGRTPGRYLKGDTDDKISSKGVKCKKKKNVQSRVHKDTSNFLASRRNKRSVILKWMECGKQARGRGRRREGNPPSSITVDMMLIQVLTSWA